MKHGIRVAVIGVLTALAAHPQGIEPSFAAVSIRPVQGRLPGLGTVLFQPGGRLSANGVTIRVLIAAAYGLPFPTPRITGGPDWVEANRETFVVEAVAEPGTISESLSPAQLREKMRPMIRQLLAERFKLVLRAERKEMQVFQLVVAASGAKLTKSSVSEAQCSAPATPNACHDLVGNRQRGMNGDVVSLGDVASLLEISSDVPVVDATGIKDLFSVRMGPYSRVTPQEVPAEIVNLPADRPRPPAEPWPSVFKVLEQDLGLRLVSGRAQVEMLRIESAQMPTAN